MDRLPWGEQYAHHWLLMFLLLFIFRYLRTFVSIFNFLTYPITPILPKPTYTSYNDVTVVIPTTFKTPDELAKCIKNILACNPFKVFVVTSKENLSALKAFCKTRGFKKSVKCLAVKKLNKRKQILEALQHVTTPITAFADDDVFWPNTKFLDYMLALFEDPNVGAGGPRQRVRRSDNPTGWWFLGVSYLERRVWNNLTTMAIDGSISTLSGRTALYRTSILRNQEFFTYFQTDKFFGRPLNSDDDKCLTRWVYRGDWSIKIQGDKRATIETTLEEDSKFLSQCLRWARASWRGNLTVMNNETYWRSARYSWGLYVIYISTFFKFSVFMDAALMGLLVLGLNRPVGDCYTEMAMLMALMTASKLLKLIPHFLRHPADMKYIPLSLTFSYLHTIINLYSVATLHHTAWGSQKIAGEVEADEFITLKPWCEIKLADDDDEDEEEEKEAGDVVIEEIATTTFAYEDALSVNDHLISIDQILIHNDDDKDKLIPIVAVCEVSDDDDF